MRVLWDLSDQVCSTLMHLVKRAWELYESRVTRFVQLSCTWSNEHENCMRVEWPVLFSSHTLGQTSMKVVWELSDQFCSTSSHALCKTSMTVVWELSYQICSPLMHSVKRAGKFYESWVTSFVELSCTRSNDHGSCKRVEWPVLISSYALGQTSTRVVRNWVTSFVQLSCTRSNEHESSMRVEWPVLFNSRALGQTSMKVVWELSDQFCSTLMYSVKRAWKLYESWVTRFVQLSCTRSKEHENCMRVEWPVLFNSHALGQKIMRVLHYVWELSDHFCSTLMYSVKRAWELYEGWVTTFVQLSCTRSDDYENCMRVEWPVLFNSHALGQTIMRVVWELSDQFFSTLMHSVKQARELFEIELPVLLNSYALSQMFKRKSCIRVEWAIFFNSHALDQTTMRVLWDLGDQVCSTLMHSVKRAWQLYESKVNRFVQLSCTRSNEHESCMRVEWPVFFNSYALGQTSTRVVWNWVTSFVQFLCTRSNERKSCMRVEWAVFFNSHALDQTTMRVVGESSDQFCSTVMHFVKREWQLYES